MCHISLVWFVPAGLMSIPCYRAQNKGQMAKSPELSVSVMFCFCTEAGWTHWPSRLSTILCSIFFIRSSIWLIRFWASISFNRISFSTSANWDAKAAASPEEARRKRTYRLSFKKLPTCQWCCAALWSHSHTNWLCMAHPSTSLLMHFTPLQKNLGSQSALKTLLSDCSPYHSPLPSRCWSEHHPNRKHNRRKHAVFVSQCLSSWSPPRSDTPSGQCFASAYDIRCLFPQSCAKKSFHTSASLFLAEKSIERYPKYCTTPLKMSLVEPPSTACFTTTVI